MTNGRRGGEEIRREETDKNPKISTMLPNNGSDSLGVLCCVIPLTALKLARLFTPKTLLLGGDYIHPSGHVLIVTHVCVCVCPGHPFVVIWLRNITENESKLFSSYTFSGFEKM